MDCVLAENFAVTHVISNLYDYVTGVEVGLDSNGRKNRGGEKIFIVAKICAE